MRTERSYRQLAATVEDQAQRMADAMLELDTALANLDGDPSDHVEVATAAVARALARLRGDALHARG